MNPHYLRVQNLSKSHSCGIFLPLKMLISPLWTASSLCRAEPIKRPAARTDSPRSIDRRVYKRAHYHRRKHPSQVSLTPHLARINFNAFFSSSSEHPEFRANSPPTPPQKPVPPSLIGRAFPPLP